MDTPNIDLWNKLFSLAEDDSLYDSNTGQLTDHGFTVVVDAINKLRLPACPTCNSNKGFNIENYLAILPGYKLQSSYPMIVVTCKTCKEMKTFSAIALGIFTSS